MSHSRAGAVARHYTTSAPAMRQRMRTMLGQYELKKTTFQDFSPEFDSDFGVHWLAAIDLADAEEQTTARIAQLKEETGEVNVAMAQARTEMQTLFYFVGRAFPHNAARLDEYGRRKYAAASASHDLMRAELEQAFKAATRDQAALAAKGYTAPHLAELHTLMEALTDKNTSQEIKKGTNKEDTDHYTTTQNLAYSFGQQVSGAAKIIFATDATLLEIFRLGDGPGPATETHELTLAPNEQKWVLFSTPLEAPVQLVLHAVDPDPNLKLHIGRSKLPDEQPLTIINLNSATPDLTVPAADLGAGPYLSVHNVGPAESRVVLRVAE